MDIAKDWKGHVGALFGFRDRYICVCPFCSRMYANWFCKGKFPDDGYKTKEEAIENWNKNQSHSK